MATLEETLGILLDARLAPLRSDLERVTSELAAVRRAMPPLFVALKEAARRMNVSEKTARRRVKSGEWPARRDGRKILVDLSALRPMDDEEVAQAALRLRMIGGGPADGSP